MTQGPSNVAAMRTRDLVELAREAAARLAATSTITADVAALTEAVERLAAVSTADHHNAEHATPTATTTTAITDTPPDIYKGERVGAGSPASGYFGGSTVATDNVWIVDGRFLTEREWSKWEHRDDPPHSREGPPPG